ncbi:MAG TPA: TetR/AcrR family transcriptional regulator [Firmicutes bacterium]|nr:TetR/AcrR family transcriptional regulator [Bacillota bacterium]
MRLRYENRKRKLLETAIHIVAEEGLGSFSMRKTTEQAGVSEALIYKHYESKENLLRVCFETVSGEIRTLFSGVSAERDISPEALPGSVHALWTRIFSFFISSGGHALFYFEYLNSRYSGGELPFWLPLLLPSAAASRFQDPVLLWDFILDTTCCFARRIIQGQIPDTPEIYDTVWKLISSGIFTPRTVRIPGAAGRFSAK